MRYFLKGYLKYWLERGVLPPHPRCARGDGEWFIQHAHTQKDHLKHPYNKIVGANTHPNVQMIQADN